MDIETMKDANGELRAYSNLGGYPVLYIADDSEVLCSTCADQFLKQGEGAMKADIFWEGPTEYCASCGSEIESAYGDPYEEE